MEMKQKPYKISQVKDVEVVLKRLNFAGHVQKVCVIQKNFMTKCILAGSQKA